MSEEAVREGALSRAERAELARGRDGEVDDRRERAAGAAVTGLSGSSEERGAGAREGAAHSAEGERDDRVVSPLADGDERAIEGALPPRRLDDFVGQARVRGQLSLLLHGALRRGRPPDHVLPSGPPGLGKATIAMIIAAELGAPLRITSGPAIERSGDLAAVLSTLSEGEVMFIDEIHRVARPAEEMLYLAMEDF